MSEIYQQNQTDEKKQDGSDKSNIVAPEGKEGVRDEESDDNKTDPGDQFRTPEPVLKSRSLVSGVVHTNQKQSQDEMKESQREVDAMYGGESIAFFACARDGGIIEEDFLQFFDSPVGEHDPGQQRV